MISKLCTSDCSFLSRTQYFLLDVLAFFVVVIFLFVYITCKMCR